MRDVPSVILTMLEGVRRYSEEVQRQAEKRITVFLSLASGSIAFLAFLYGRQLMDDSSRLWVPSVVCFILFVFGIETLHSINWKMIYLRVLYGYDYALRERLGEVSPAQKEINGLVNESEKLMDKRKTRGSLAEFMYLPNTLLAGGIPLSIGLYMQWCWCACLALVIAAGGSAFWFQYVYLRSIREIVPRDWEKTHLIQKTGTSRRRAR